MAEWWLAHGLLNPAWEEKVEAEQEGPPTQMELGVMKILREASRIISYLMTHHGSSLLHGGQDSICLIQIFLSPEGPSKMAFWLLLFPRSPVPSSIPLITVPQPDLVHPYIFILCWACILCQECLSPPSVHWAATHPSKFSTNATFYVTICLPLDNQHLWHCIVIMCLPL